MTDNPKPKRIKRAPGELTKAQARRLPTIDLTRDMEEDVVRGARKHAERFAHVR